MAEIVDRHDAMRRSPLHECGADCPLPTVRIEPLPGGTEFGFVNPENGDFIGTKTDAFVDRLRRAGWQIEPSPTPKPDGWHTYHICGGQLREIEAVGATGFGGDGFLLCVHCGERYETKLTTEAGR